MLDFFSADMRRNPYPVYDQIRSSSPLLHDPRTDIWLIFDYDGVRRALNDHEVFSSAMSTAGRGNPQWFFFFDPPAHTRQRALIMKAFTPRMVANLEPRIRELARALIRLRISQARMDLASDFSIPLPMMVIAEMLGIPAGDWARFSRWSETILRLSYTVSETTSERAMQAAEGFRTVSVDMLEYLEQLLAERRASRRDDLLTSLALAEVDGEHLTNAEILGVFQLLLVAGTETTTNLINNAMLCFIEHPDQFARLRAEPERLTSAVEEVLRYRTPIQWIFRATKSPVKMQGQTIPAGKLVLPMIGAANRDPRQFYDSGRFDIGRDPNPHIAFGHGIHFCLGAALARLEARIALTELLGRLHDIARANDNPWEPRQALHVHGPQSLPIQFRAAQAAG
jgi:cytochrome P450